MSLLIHEKQFGFKMKEYENDRMNEDCELAKI